MTAHTSQLALLMLLIPAQAGWSLPDREALLADGLLPALSELPKVRGAGTTIWTLYEQWAGALAAVPGDGGFVAAHWYLNAPRVALHEFVTGQQLWQASTQPKNSDAALAVARDSRRVVAAFSDWVTGRDLFVSAWNADSSIPLWTTQLGKAEVFLPDHERLAISADGQTVAVLNRDPVVKERRLHVLNGGTGSTHWSIQLPGSPSYEISGVDVSRDGSRVIVGLGDRTLIFSNIGNPLAEFPNAACCHLAHAFTIDGKKAVIRDGPNKVAIVTWDGTTYTKTWGATINSPLAWRAALSPDGTYVVVHGTQIGNGGCLNNRIYIYKPPATLPYSTYDRLADHACLQSIEFSKDGTRAVIGTAGSLETQETATDLLYDMAAVLDLRTFLTPTPLFRLLDDIDDKGSVSKVSMSDDGKRVVVATRGCHVQALCFGGGHVYAIQLLI